MHDQPSIMHVRNADERKGSPGGKDNVDAGHKGRERRRTRRVSRRASRERRGARAEAGRAGQVARGAKQRVIAEREGRVENATGDRKEREERGQSKQRSILRGTACGVVGRPGSFSVSSWCGRYARAFVSSTAVGQISDVVFHLRLNYQLIGYSSDALQIVSEIAYTLSLTLHHELLTLFELRV
ncbi:hypothetical protein FB451DRAFT_1167893 [Mycena latifolia]|nr:hypothetical protein FB451DRAFT_1167893 [Mycena latifolia]